MRSVLAVLTALSPGLLAFDADQYYFYYDRAFVLTNQHRRDSQLKFDLRNVFEVDVRYSVEAQLPANHTRYRTTLALSTDEAPTRKRPSKDKCDDDGIEPIENTDEPPWFNQTVTLRPVGGDQHFGKYEFTWTRLYGSSAKNQEVCFYSAFNNAQLYSTFVERRQQRWPQDTNRTDACARELITGRLGPIVENVFVFTSGFAVVLNQTQTPVTVRRDANQGYPLLCFGAVNQSEPNTNVVTTLAFDIYIDYCDRPPEQSCVSLDNNNLLLYRNVTQKYRNGQQIPRATPDEQMFVYPIWSVWSGHSNPINQSEVLQFGWSLFALHDFRSSLLEIDSHWQRFPGDLAFDKTRFPNPSKMVAKLRQLGQRVALSVGPFLSVNSSNYARFEYTLAKNQFGQLVRTEPEDGSNYNESLGLFDFSRTGVARWFESRLRTFRASVGFDSYSFTAGQSTLYSDHFAVFADASIREYPSLLTAQYTTTCAQLGPLVQVNSAYRSQHLPVFFKLEQSSDWQDFADSFIPKVLTASLAGYSFIVPQLTGGVPSEELYIRWVQATSLMPVMKFTIPPWVYTSQSVLNTTHKFVDLHTRYSPTILRLAKQTTVDGMPIIRPMWFTDPTDPNTTDIADQYMLGDEVLVAPVFTEGTRERRVYFPRGIWLDATGHQSYQGPIKVTVPAPLDQLPYFTLFDRN